MIKFPKSWAKPLEMKKPICLNFIALSIPLAYEYNGSTPYKKLEGTKISKIFIGPWVVTWPQKPSQDCCHWLVKCSPVPRTATSSRQYKTLETRLQTTHIIFYSHQFRCFIDTKLKSFFQYFELYASTTGEIFCDPSCSWEIKSCYWHFIYYWHWRL